MDYNENAVWQLWHPPTEKQQNSQQLEDIAAEIHAIAKVLTPFNNEQYNKIEQELEDIEARLHKVEEFIEGMGYTE